MDRGEIIEEWELLCLMEGIMLHDAAAAGWPGWLRGGAGGVAERTGELLLVVCSPVLFLFVL
jgi:hypothetical protein